LQRSVAGFVLVKAHDGYRAVYALAEVHHGVSPERRILVADTVDGKPLSGDMGKLRIANQGEAKSDDGSARSWRLKSG